ncbi:MAG: uncharacterized protein QOJ70_2306 [Acidobacteriota bacterium]|nr:uncharacterized protein [Acidobacteriota bacterium]
MASHSRRTAIVVVVFVAALCLLVTGVNSQSSIVLRRVTNTAPEALNINPSLSGDGRRLAFESSADIAATGAGGGFRLIAADTSGQGSFKELALARAPAPALSQDGERVAFASREDPTGENADGDSEIFFYDGERLRQLTRTLADEPARRTSEGCFRPSVSDDARLVVFSSDRDLVGSNAERKSAIFLLDTQTLKLTQISSGESGTGARDAKISGDGSRVLYVRDRVTDDGSTTSELLIYFTSSGETLSAATNLTSLTMTYGRAVSDDGLRIVYSARGTNNATQVFMLDGRNDYIKRQLTQLGTRASDVPLHATISGDGNRVTFATRRNVVGGNSDASVELYLYDVPSNVTTRLTDAPAAANVEVVSSLNDDGTLVAFNFPRVLTERGVAEQFENDSEIYLADLPTRTQTGAGLQLFNAAVPGKTPPSGALAPDSIAILTGKNLALSSNAAARLADGSFPVSFQNVRVTIGGRAAQIFFVSPSQIHFALPTGLEVGATEISVFNHDGFELRGSLAIARTAPGVFTTSGNGSGEALALDNFTLRPGPFDVTDAAGDPRRLIIFCTGLRDASKVEAVIGGRTVRVEAVVPSPDLPGLDQLHVALTTSLRGAGATSLVVRADGVESNRTSLTLTSGGPPPRAARVEVSPASSLIPVGGEMRLKVKAFDSLGEEIENPDASFTVDDPSVASVASVALVEATGIATGLSPGNVVVRASVGEASADALLRVVPRTLVINEVLADPPDGLAGDANHDGTRSGTDDEFVEMVNGSDDPLDLSGWTLRTRAHGGTSESVRHTFPAGSALPPGEALALFGGGNFDTADPFFGGALVARASSGSLSLTNTGLTILVRDGSGNLVTQFAYGTAGDNFGGDSVDQSATRSPDITGAFVRHTSANSARRFSPGVKADGSFFLERTGRLTRITLNAMRQTVFVGEAAQFTAQAFDQYDRPLKDVVFNFESSDASVAAVETTSVDAATGIVNASLKGLSPGETKVRATATVGLVSVSSSDINLIVQKRPPKIVRVEVTPALVNLNRGGSLQLTANAFDENEQPVAGVPFNWSSSDSTVASIDATGVLQATGVGPVQIIVTTPDNRGADVSGRAEVNVRLPLVINELLADVAPDNPDTPEPEGDANHDGVRSADDDEFVELFNDSAEAVELSGVQISDASSVRFTFPAHTSLEAGRAVVVFGGGSPPTDADAFGGALVFKTGSLSLNDTGDTLNVKLPLTTRTVVIDSLVYGTSGGVAAPKDQSLTRSPDAGPAFVGGEFTAHTKSAGSAGRIYSPGARADGTPFGSPPLTRIEVSPASAALEVGGARDFTARAFARMGAVEFEVTRLSFIWSASDPKKATISPSEGRTVTAKALASGNVSLFARAGSIEGSAALNVNPTPTPTPSPTPTSTPTPTSSPTPSPSPTPTPTPSTTPTVTPTPTPAPSPTPTPIPSPTAMPTPTPSPSTTPSPTPTPSATPTPQALVVISQVYGGAGCSTLNCSTFKNDFVELYNRGASIVSLGGWSVQYAAATGTGAWQVTALNNFTLAPGQHYLVQESGNANGVNSLPAPDASGSIALSATAGKVALVNTVTALNGACPNAAGIVDLVGYGATANCFESAPAPAPGTTTAVVRNDEGCTDTGHNSVDFKVGPPNPRNSASAVHACASAQTKTGEPFLDSGRALPSLYLFTPMKVLGESYIAASGELLSGMLSESYPTEGSTRWRRDALAYAPRGMRGVRPRPPAAWP